MATGIIKKQGTYVRTNFDGFSILAGSNINSIMFTQDGAICFIDFLNGNNDGLRLGAAPEGVWLQYIRSGMPGEYLFVNH